MRNRDGAAGANETQEETAVADIKLVHNIWVLIADGEKALFLRNEGDAEYPNLQVVREMHE